MLSFKKCDNCTGPVCICGQDHSDKNMRWCDRSDLEIENDRLKAENARYRKALEKIASPRDWHIDLFFIEIRPVIMIAREALKEME